MSTFCRGYKILMNVEKSTRHSIRHSSFSMQEGNTLKVSLTCFITSRVRYQMSKIRNSEKNQTYALVFLSNFQSLVQLWEERTSLHENVDIMLRKHKAHAARSGVSQAGQSQTGA